MGHATPHRPFCPAGPRRSRLGRNTIAGVAEVESGPVRSGGPRGQVHPAAHGRRLVPLVPRDGRHDLSRRRDPEGDRREVHPGSRRPGRRPRALLSLRGVGLACHHHARQGRQRDLQAPGLHPAGAVQEAAGRSDRGPIGAALTEGRRRDRSECCRPHRRTPHQDRASDDGRLRQGAWRLRPRATLHPWRHAGMGARTQPGAAAQRQYRNLAGRRGQDARRRAPPHRSGVGRHVPVFGQDRLVEPALREAAEHPARCAARLCAGLRDQA